MAILCLSDDFEDLKNRLGNIFIGYTFDKKPIYAREEKFSGIATYIPLSIKVWRVETEAYWNFPWSRVYDAVTE